MKLTRRLLKEQIEKTLREARTFDQFMKGDDVDYTDTDVLDARDQKNVRLMKKRLSVYKDYIRVLKTENKNYLCKVKKMLKL